MTTIQYYRIQYYANWVTQWVYEFPSKNSYASGNNFKNMENSFGIKEDTNRYTGVFITREIGH